ncbi:mechanosensitive ion channel domain-containing protein [Neptunomonas antarctica]|uniref:Potassium efflux system protein n=1 Tax=Neptunomonas antarctica TaxID=619304 RepID=A0A1N7J2N8_9GAMM|nr:mechanosensitive ion channel domain-containing protein [Neptunomonas antarctica]SIS43481.1 potassium efflux system protein [Neptunomonas antarctica]
MAHISRFVFLIFLCISPLTLASNQESVSLYQQRLDQLSVDENNPASMQRKETYQQILFTYKEAVQLETKATQLKAMLKNQPEVLKRLKDSLQTELSIIDSEALQQKTVPELEQMLTLGKAEYLEIEQAKEQLQKQINQSDQKLSSLREQLISLKQATATPDNQTDNEWLDAQFALRAAKNQALELEVLSLPGQNDLNRFSMEKINRDLNQKQDYINTLQDTIQTQRRAETEQTLQTLTSDNIDAAQNPLISSLAVETQRLSDTLRTVIATSEKALKQRRLLDAQLAIVSQSYIAVQQQLELSTQPLGVELRKFTQRLSQPVSTSETRKNINRLRLLNLEITRSLFNAENNAENNESSLSEHEASQLKQLREDKQNLSARIRDASNQSINELSQLLSIQEQVNKQINLGRELISQHLLWIPSILPVSGQWFTEIIQGIKPLAALLKPNNNVPFWQPANLWVPKVAALLLLIVLSFVTYKRYSKNAEIWTQQVGNVIHDRFSHTFGLFVMPALITVPVPAAIMIFTRNVMNPEAWSPESLPMIAFTIASLSWTYLTLCIWNRSSNGLLQGHFSVPEKLCNKLRKLLHPLFWLSLPLIILLLFIDQSDSTALRSGLGRLIFLALAILVTLFWAALRKVAPHIDLIIDSQHWWQRSQLWLTGLVGIHLVIIGAALLGYVYTGSIIMLLLLVLTGILYTTFIFFKLGNRWLLIEERYLAFERAKARRNEILEAREKNEDVPPLEENYINLQSISDQARILLKTTTVILLVTLLWMLLKNALPTLDILDNVVLWSHDVTTSAGIISESITLKNILFSSALITLCILAAYNLPGLLELLVLRHMTLSPGTTYAVTTITKYILIVISILAGTSQLGLEWSKLQWLIAAMGVGLGFGLQEIVANFVSGLIILFEKPIRIGDTITIGGFSGTVTRIQIRATTITDWDRKEIIIPNKSFVTDQLINWSLTDPITRLVIKIGVAYGSDTRLAHKLLLDAAKQHPNVLKDPEPSAYFTTFGASSLDLELRLFVSTMADRLPVAHDINLLIDDTFKAHNIEIAFPQLDVHLHRSPKT